MTVENKIDDGQTTSIHWHGLYQRGSAFMDGVARFTQCAIAPGEKFKQALFIIHLHSVFTIRH